MAIWDRKSLAQSVAMQAQLTPGQAEAALIALGRLVADRVRCGDTLILEEFGLFEPHTRDDGSRAVRFRQALNVREKLNAG